MNFVHFARWKTFLVELLEIMKNEMSEKKFPQRKFGFSREIMKRTEQTAENSKEKRKNVRRDAKEKENLSNKNESALKTLCKMIWNQAWRNQRKTIVGFSEIETKSLIDEFFFVFSFYRQSAEKKSNFRRVKTKEKRKHEFRWAKLKFSVNFRCGKIENSFSGRKKPKLDEKLEENRFEFFFLKAKRKTFGLRMLTRSFDQNEFFLDVRHTALSFSCDVRDSSVFRNFDESRTENQWKYRQN